MTDTIYAMGACEIVMAWHSIFILNKFTMNELIHDLEVMVNLSKGQLKPHSRKDFQKHRGRRSRTSKVYKKMTLKNLNLSDKACSFLATKIILNWQQEMVSFAIKYLNGIH